MYVLLGLSVLFFFGSLEYQNYQLKNERVKTTAELGALREEYASTSVHLLANIDLLSKSLATTTGERDSLALNLGETQKIVDTMRTQIESVSGAVNVLEKLNSIDKELLEKYSRVYFLNENYVPKALVLIPSSYVYEPEKDKFVLHDVLPFLTRLMDAAALDGVDLRVISAYRSFGAQGMLKSAYTMTYGSQSANKFSADQGYSEHQLGSTVDFTTSILGAKFTTFAKTTAYRWLTDNAYQYGFVLSYPTTNTYYIFEPWHWRFVGKGLAKALHENRKYFYDLPQREIDPYRLTLFDQ